MRRKLLVPFLVLPLIAYCTHTSAQSHAPGPIQLPAGTTIPAMLDKWIDSRKSKIGDEVIAETTEHVKADGRVVIPKGSKILGVVTHAKTRTKDESGSVIGIAFDRVVLKQGGEMPLRLIIQAIAPDRSTSVPVMPLGPAKAGGSGGEMTSTTGQGPRGQSEDAPGRPESPENSAYEQTGGLTASGGLTPQCHGVLGIDGLVLGFEPKNNISLIASQTKNVRLDGRTQLMLRVTEK